MPGSPGSQGDGAERSAQSGAKDGTQQGDKGGEGEQAAGAAGDGEQGAGPDQPTLEDSQNAAAGGEGVEGDAQTEAAVLDEALEAMRRTGAEPGLEDAASNGAQGSTGPQGAAGGGASGDGTTGSGAQQQAGAAQGPAGTTTGSGGGGEAAQLNRELNESLARFDGAILGERDRIQARAEETGDGAAQAESAAMLDPEAPADRSGEYGSVEEGPAPGGAEGGGAEGNGGGAHGNGSGAATQNDSSSGSGMSTAGGGSGRQGDYKHTASANTAPPDIPDGSDDDVVARQIREAAMKERDPELREKLWDEYRKYVNGTKGKS